MDPKKLRDNKIGPKVVEALEKRFFEAYYIESKDDVLKKVLELIPQDESVSWGGTMTVDSLGIKEALKEKGYTLIDRDTAQTPEERQKLMHDALNCGTFLMSSNAITEKGELFNIDGAANRVAALCYGPKHVLVIAGVNKIVKDMDAAYKKVRTYTAPINAQRFCKTTPCSITGECGDCINQESICAQFVETRICRPAKRIKVIIVGEDLGI
ncbi:lactate utilization protein [Treponema sp.]|uniref:lactate utilization protein n=1 Tax=Treponema sp. TaxID=166 RepID=UPI00298DE162|nr:lactate utilization protein [Treponema sp.]MCR5613032.1 lactate utilization protein [Treponema sp.]